MLSEALLQKSKELILADINYGDRFKNISFLNPQEALKLLQVGDIVIQYVPQLSRDMLYYNEFIVKGCMHISVIAEFGEKNLYKIELIEKGMFCDPGVFDDFDRHDIHLKRYYIVMRSKRVAQDLNLQKSLNNSIMRFAGFVDMDGIPVRLWEVKANFLLRTHEIKWGGTISPPRSLYCSELTYLAYKENGIDICPLHSLDELIDALGAYPSRKDTKRIAKIYAMGNKSIYWAYMLLFGWEHAMRKLGIHFLRPFRLFSKDAAWPQFIIENKEFEILTVVPPPERYIKQYESILQAARQRESAAARVGAGTAM